MYGKEPLFLYYFALFLNVNMLLLVNDFGFLLMRVSTSGVMQLSAYSVFFNLQNISSFTLFNLKMVGNMVLFESSNVIS